MYVNLHASTYCKTMYRCCVRDGGLRTSKMGKEKARKVGTKSGADDVTVNYKGLEPCGQKENWVG